MFQTTNQMGMPGCSYGIFSGFGVEGKPLPKLPGSDSNRCPTNAALLGIYHGETAHFQLVDMISSAWWLTLWLLLFVAVMIICRFTILQKSKIWTNMDCQRLLEQVILKQTLHDVTTLFLHNSWSMQIDAAHSFSCCMLLEALKLEKASANNINHTTSNLTQRYKKLPKESDHQFISSQLTRCSTGYHLASCRPHAH